MSEQPKDSAAETAATTAAAGTAGGGREQPAPARSPHRQEHVRTDGEMAVDDALGGTDDPR
jgi:hypothetical protein